MLWFPCCCRQPGALPSPGRAAGRGAGPAGTERPAGTPWYCSPPGLSWLSPPCDAICGHCGCCRRHCRPSCCTTCVLHRALDRSPRTTASRPPRPPPPQVRASGMVVNSMGWVLELGYEILKHTIEVRLCSAFSLLPAAAPACCSGLTSHADLHAPLRCLPPLPPSLCPLAYQHCQLLCSPSGTQVRCGAGGGRRAVVQPAERRAEAVSAVHPGAHQPTAVHY